MCEWLSSGEWCDVQIFCGDRVFNAHRAVLASVSSFLRRMLIACPVEETPTYIFLPDFDGEVFSSILYYIYNGEVIIQNHNLATFIDIIKVLEIFVDHQSLEKIRIGLGDCNLDLCIYHEIQCSQNNNVRVFTMSSCNNKNQKYVNIRKGIGNQDIHLQYSHGDSDFRDKQTRCNNWIELQPSLENLQLPYAGRQRNSFLRDVFAETYPRNGNANGLKASVPAISNEHYRGPTSVFLTNANGKHPRADNALSEISTRITEQNFCMEAEEYKLNIENGYTPVENGSHQFPEPICLPNSIPNFLQNKILSRSIIKKVHPNLSLLPTAKLPINWSSPEHSIKNSVMDQTSILELSVQIPQNNTIDANSEKYIGNHTVDDDVQLESVNKSGKATIFNHVLENPWCPRLPKYYRQFSKKNENVIMNKKNDVIINDNNNNIQPPAITSVDKIEKDNLKHNDEFKCGICKQVFTSSEDLTVHGRRHSTTGRYACGECGKTFSQLRNFKYHMSVHRGTREFAATCTVCGKYFNDRGYLSSHMKIHRNRKEYKCNQCPKSFNQRVAYNMHVRIHTGIKPHVCEECGKAFSRKMLLKQHQRTHSGERPYACPHCDKRFADRSNMTLHLRLHTGVKPFSCSLCPKSFTKKHHLKSHLNFHTGAKPYSCPRCKLAFTQSSNMRTHLKKCSAPEQILKATL